MKKVLAALAAMGVATSVYAACTTTTYTINGKITTCTTCCYGSSCTTNCF